MLAPQGGTGRAALVARIEAPPAGRPTARSTPSTRAAAIGVVGKGGKQRLVPLSPTVGPRWRHGWSCGAMTPDRCSVALTAAATSVLATASPARPSARPWLGAPWPPGWVPSPPMTCAGPTRATCSTPVTTCRRCDSSWATPPRRRCRARTAGATRPDEQRPSAQPRFRCVRGDDGRPRPGRSRRPIRLFGFQQGVTVASRAQLGRPA